MFDETLKEQIDMPDTRRRILGAAGRIFGARRFQDATIREICREAGVNIAAVNYHFRDKKGLYLETLKYCQMAATEKYPFDAAADRSSSPSVRLTAFVSQLVRRVFDEGEASWFGKLMAREMVEPTEGLDVVVEEVARPIYALLFGIVEELLGDRATDTDIRLCCASIIGQSVFFFFHQPLIRRLLAGEEWDDSKAEVIAGHIVRFSLGAIKAIAEPREGDNP